MPSAQSKLQVQRIHRRHDVRMSLEAEIRILLQMLDVVNDRSSASSKETIFHLLDLKERHTIWLKLALGETTQSEWNLMGQRMRLQPVTTSNLPGQNVFRPVNPPANNAINNTNNNNRPQIANVQPRSQPQGDQPAGQAVNIAAGEDGASSLNPFSYANASSLALPMPITFFNYVEGSTTNFGVGKRANMDDVMEEEGTKVARTPENSVSTSASTTAASAGAGEVIDRFMGRFQVRSALASDSIETSAAPASSPLSTSSSSSSTSTNSINAAPAFGKA